MQNATGSFNGKTRKDPRKGGLFSGPSLMIDILIAPSDSLERDGHVRRSGGLHLRRQGRQ